jgi:hypothetical protein
MHNRTISTMTSFSCCGSYGARCHSASDGHALVLVDRVRKVNDLDQGQSAQRFPQHDGDEHKDLESWLLSQFELLILLSRSVFYRVGHRIRIVPSKISRSFFSFEFLASIWPSGTLFNFFVRNRSGSPQILRVWPVIYRINSADISQELTQLKAGPSGHAV